MKSPYEVKKKKILSSPEMVQMQFENETVKAAEATREVLYSMSDAAAAADNQQKLYTSSLVALVASEEAEERPILGAGTSTDVLSEASLRLRSSDKTQNEFKVCTEESALILSLTKMLLQSLDSTHDHSQQVVTYTLPDNREMSIPNPNSNSSISSSSSRENSILDAFQCIQELGKNAHRRVCQHPFRKNDIVWVCRTCQADETCVLCHACWSDSDHVGHDASFYHAQAGGCCDCGDPDAWDPKGFCSKHGPPKDGSRESSRIPDANGMVNGLPWIIVAHARGIVQVCLDWLADEIAAKSERRFWPLQDENTDLIQNWTTMDNLFANVDSMDVDCGGSVMSTGSVSSEPVVLNRAQKNYALAEEGLNEGGLYLVVHGGDGISRETMKDGLKTLFTAVRRAYSDTLPRNVAYEYDGAINRVAGKIAEVARKSGDVVVLGTSEILNMAGQPSVINELWKDQDKLTMNRVGEIISEWAEILVKLGIPCSIKTLQQIKNEQRAYAMLEWLGGLAKSCDALCEQICIATDQEKHLAPILRTNLRLPKRLMRAYHSLQLTLLAVPEFKAQLANAYCDTYEGVTAEYASGVGVADCSSYTLSVQFLNRQTYVHELAVNSHLLKRLINAFFLTIQKAVDNAKDDYGCLQLNASHSVLTNRRYSPCVSDLKCVLNVSGMPQSFCSLARGSDGSSSSLETWIKAMALVQGSDEQVWRLKKMGHVEHEARAWVGAFNLSISLGSLFERVLAWNEAMSEDEEHMEISVNPKSSLLEVSLTVLLSIFTWQQKHSIRYQPSKNPTWTMNRDDVFKAAPVTLPVSTVSCFCGMSTVALPVLSVSYTSPISFHIPLHRFLASCLREICRSPSSLMNGAHTGTINELIHNAISLKLESGDYCGKTIFRTLMEYPVLVLSHAAHIRAGLWRRHGPSMQDQVLNYVEPPFCRSLRDSDLMILQFAMLSYRSPHNSSLQSSNGTAFLINLLAHRFGIFDFAGLVSAPEEYSERYIKELKDGLYSPEIEVSEVKNSEMDDIGIAAPQSKAPKINFPWTSSPAIDDSMSFGIDILAALSLLEEFLHLLIVLVTELPPPPLEQDSNWRSEQAKQAKNRLRREVIHRLASGPKRFSELAEVHHILSMRDNTALSDEGRERNPDEAAEAALHTVLYDVANELPAKGFESKQWELKKEVWIEYDPAFFHVGLRAHQSAAELRPGPKVFGNDINSSSLYPYAPRPSLAHESFARLRRDLTADACLLSILYRILHIHCSNTPVVQHPTLQSSAGYDKDGLSETALARAIHLLTLGCYAWSDENEFRSCGDWKENGGAGEGSIFYNYTGQSPVGIKQWVEIVLFSKPSELINSHVYDDSAENMFALLNNLVSTGGGRGGFVAQDSSIRSGAKWICSFATRHSSLAGNEFSRTNEEASSNKESDLERRKREAKERTMNLFNAKISSFNKFADEMDDLSSSEEEGDDLKDSSSHNFKSDDEVNYDSEVTTKNLREAPRCIICNDDSIDKSSLALCGYVQSSTVLKGCRSNLKTATSRFVGLHVAFCGHAVHNSCFLQYVKTGNRHTDPWAEREGPKAEFRCPFCQRISNCLLPYVDVCKSWIDVPSLSNEKLDESEIHFAMETEEDIPNSNAIFLKDFLESKRWNDDLSWDGRCCHNVEAIDTIEESESAETNKNDRPTVKKLLSWRSDSIDEVESTEASNNVRPSVKKLLSWRSVLSKSMRINRRRRLTDSSNETNKNNDTDKVKAEIWKGFIDKLCDFSFSADLKRIGQGFHQNYGNYRHTYAEQNYFNKSVRTPDDETEWPQCVVESIGSDSYKFDFEHEAIISKTLFAIESFVYSVCCESFDAKIQVNRKGLDANRSYGVKSVSCNGLLIRLPAPTDENGGEQPFDGRIGKLRLYALSLMAVSEFVAKDLIYLIFFSKKDRRLNRALIAYPLLNGHILTTTSAAIVACYGSAAFRDPDDTCYADEALNDCINFVKLGLLGRILQVLLSEIGYVDLDLTELNNLESHLFAYYDISTQTDAFSVEPWRTTCLTLLRIALDGRQPTSSNANVAGSSHESFHLKFRYACSKALTLAADFLSDASLILQIVAPSINKILGPTEANPPNSLFSIMEWLQIESLDSLLSSKSVQSLISLWYNDSISYIVAIHNLPQILDCTHEFRGQDWPFNPSADMSTIEDDSADVTSSQLSSSLGSVGQFSLSTSPTGTRLMAPPKSSTNRCVPLLGHHFSVVSNTTVDTSKPRLNSLPTSYTDLYAKLGYFSPESEQTAVCLVCGEVLNASGKGRCTQHAVTCGAGCGVFFLLQDCIVVIINGMQAAYLNSPYVDSHGETPQYRGRPLNLDMDRYKILQELWLGHHVREKVVKERVGSRQVIVENYY